jgi:hypothetical protein
LVCHLLFRQWNGQKDFQYLQAQKHTGQTHFVCRKLWKNKDAHPNSNAYALGIMQTHDRGVSIAGDAGESGPALRQHYLGTVALICNQRKSV